GVDSFRGGRPEFRRVPACLRAGSASGLLPPVSRIRRCARGRSRHARRSTRGGGRGNLDFRSLGLRCLAYGRGGERRLANSPPRPAVLEEIRAAIAAALVEAHDASPFKVLLVPARTLPRTLNGKISRSECRREMARLVAAPESTSSTSAIASPPVAEAGGEDAV